MAKVKALLLVVVIVLVGCSGKASRIAYTAIGANGDAKHGQELFNGAISKAPACATCHTLSNEMMTGPGLGKLKSVADTRVQGQSAREYIFHSIVEPGIYLVPGFSNVMYPDYDQVLSAQDVTDLIEYLLNSELDQ